IGPVLGCACAGALTLAGAAIAGNGGTLPLPAHSPNAHHIREAYVFVLVFAAVVFFGVEGALVTLIVKYRRGKRPRTADGLQIHGSTRLEILWTVVPVLILTAIASFIFVNLPSIANIPAASAADSTSIQVEGHQFYWLFRYPGGAVSIGKMIAPANDVVSEQVTAPSIDVLHSWWVPELGGKIDAIPGHTNSTWFKAPVGDYAARCSDLCGIQHAKMTAQVDVVPRAQYEQFVAQRKAAPTSLALGKEEYQHVCAVCHRLSTTYVGPSLGDNPLLTDANGLKRIIRQGVGKMPAVGNDWSNDQIVALVAYTKTLKTKAKSGG
ncbi:MAG TPA: cytochrome c oxidase subunit II, partial [Gaiellaceae bacterium]|nr:cytochrome c oxidase subunit II [Gaiellaceae bacterium]